METVLPVGIYPGVILKATAGANAETIPNTNPALVIADDWTYNVSVDTPDGHPLSFVGVKPSQVRPNAKTMSARPGDPCAVLVYGNGTIHVQVVEAVYFKACQ